ncbi:hypothetical protein RBG61_12795 [Paludicola sp. MB14-C6]|uniref:hypothetical protein n=1 Tax=Paludihabitans sp. MB14-C6 TaxID=3070656 RepID=UPI0027DC3037|nr:hypothetical protein [Paludicola sp. MB14-C6]WMJ22855.1 hypothetical protein RBG61_12795 [Paludicola sp. MB14-C6]
MSEYVHLCLSDLLEEDLSSQEYFNTLPDDVRQNLLLIDNITTFEELQEQARILKTKMNNNHWN